MGKRIGATVSGQGSDYVVRLSEDAAPNAPQWAQRGAVISVGTSPESARERAAEWARRNGVTLDVSEGDALDMIATLTGGRVETTGGNMRAVVVSLPEGAAVLVTEDGGSFTVAYCTDHAGRDDAHDHAEHDEIRTALTMVETVAIVRARTLASFHATAPRCPHDIPVTRYCGTCHDTARVWDWDGVHKDGCRCPVCR